MQHIMFQLCSKAIISTGCLSSNETDENSQKEDTTLYLVYPGNEREMRIYTIAISAINPSISVTICVCVSKHPHSTQTLHAKLEGTDCLPEDAP